MKLAPSDNPEKESDTFSRLGLMCAVVGLFLWFIAIPGLAFSVRGLILSKRVDNKRNSILSIVGLVLSLISLTYYFAM